MFNGFSFNYWNCYFAIFAVCVFEVPQYSLICILLGASVAFKGLSYILNKPASEVMYIPTNRDIKFKYKGWIDMFGGCSTKSFGGMINKIFGYSFSALMVYGMIISL